MCFPALFPSLSHTTPAFTLTFLRLLLALTTHTLCHSFSLFFVASKFKVRSFIYLLKVSINLIYGPMPYQGDDKVYNMAKKLYITQQVSAFEFVHGFMDCKWTGRIFYEWKWKWRQSVLHIYKL
jgi:hypothetical protein